MAKKVLIDLEAEKVKAYERQIKRKKKARNKKFREEQEKLRRAKLGLDDLPKLVIEMPVINLEEDQEEADSTEYLAKVEMLGLYKRFFTLYYLNRLGNNQKFNELCQEYGYIDENGQLQKEAAMMLRAVSLNSEARYKRVKRLTNRLKVMFAYGEVLIFSTLTFTDEVLNSTTPEQRKEYVKRWCERNSTAWIANIDYGDENEREHYHALNVGWQIPSTWSYGKSNFKMVPPYESDATAVTKYIFKFQNHAMKGSNRKQRVMYSRLPDIIRTKDGELVIDSDTGKLPSKHSREELDAFIQERKDDTKSKNRKGQTLVDPYEDINEREETK